MALPEVIAVDWGTTRLRATLLDDTGRVLESTVLNCGVQDVAEGDFPATLKRACGHWLASDREIQVMAAGMVGSRNGWTETPYVACPAGRQELAMAIVRLDNVSLVPGVEYQWPDGAYEVMRGEETQIIGTNVANGMVCLPGTHSKWAELTDGKINRFATFVTGELYAAISSSFLSKLAVPPDDQEVGHAAGQRVASWHGGLGRLLFQARAQVLSGKLTAQAVKPFLSSLIVSKEIEGASELFGQMDTVHLVAESPHRDVYAAALTGRNVEVIVHDPTTAFLSGLMGLFAKAKS